MRTGTRLIIACGLMWSTALTATENVAFAYDARGRLVQVARSGTVNNGVTSSYAYDPADNRTQVTVTGAGASAPSFSLGSAAVTEGGVLGFTVTRSGDLSASQSVSWESAGNSATSGSDFTAGSGTLTFAATEATKAVSVSTLQDTVYEGNETLFVNLSAATGGATISVAQGVGTIIDDDAPPPQPSFAISDVTVVEGGTLVFTVTKTGTGSGNYTVNYASADGTAVAASDYTAGNGTLTFASSDTSKTISIATIDDVAVEPSETLLVNLTSPSGGATLSDGQGVGTITDNDVVTGPTLSVSDAGNTEGLAVNFIITRGGDTSASVSVSYATAIGTAAANDFTAKSGTVTFAAGQTSKTVSVPTTQDARIEPDETFTLNLSNPTGGAIITNAQAIGTIYNDDGGGGGCPTVCR